jgi:hypothetical protein
VALAHALHPAFLAAACAAFGVWIVAIVGIKQVPLKRGFDDAPEPAFVESAGPPLEVGGNRG